MQISIHALREEGDMLFSAVGFGGCGISIHALREEGDDKNGKIYIGPYYISIHALREEGDRRLEKAADTIYPFLSTPSARRATPHKTTPHKLVGNFYPRPPRGGRQLCLLITVLIISISIHALREEGDVLFEISMAVRVTFLSTPSARRATAKTEKNISAFVSL